MKVLLEVSIHSIHRDSHLSYGVTVLRSRQEEIQWTDGQKYTQTKQDLLIFNNSLILFPHPLYLCMPTVKLE